MSKLIEVDFQNGKVKQDEETSSSIKSYQQVVKSNVLVVDFKTRKLVESIKTEEVVVNEYDLTHFNTPPCGTNFEIFTDQERFEESEHILKFIGNNSPQDISFNDVLHFINMGVLDKKKVAEKFNMVYDDQEAG